MPDLVALNAELLRDPDAIPGHPLVRSLAQRDPDLGFLCPLVRALVEIENGSCAAATAQAALATSWLVDDSAINRPEDWEAGDNLEVVEIVEHQISADFLGTSIPLRFLSEADLLYCSEEYKDHVTAATLADLLIQKDGLALLKTPNALVDWLIKQAGDPMGEPEGEDEPLCSIRYQLVGIGGVDVAGPALVNGYHEISLEDLNEDYQQRPDDEAFCWLHALTNSQAEQLGLSTASAAPGSPESDTPPPYPSWVAQDDDAEACWLTADQLQQSYALGRRLRNRERPIRLELVCGLDWDPRHDSEQFTEGELEAGGVTFPDGHRPLINIALDPEAGTAPDELRRLRSYLEKLAQAASTGRGG